MGTTNGFICLYRQITQWEWYKNPNTFRLFVHCLLMANFTDGRFEGHEVKRGQFVTSLPSLSVETSLSVRQVRVALDHLIMTGELTSKAYPKYRVITVVKYNEYQPVDRQIDSQMTGKRQADDSQMTGKRQQYNKNNKEINIDVVDSNIINLSPGEAAESIRKDQEIENAAMNVGLTVSPASMLRARNLEAEYGFENLLEAIGAAVDAPKWSYVEGVLRNRRREKSDAVKDRDEIMRRSSSMMIEALRKRGEWDDEYQCATDIANGYRDRGISPDEAQNGTLLKNG